MKMTYLMKLMKPKVVDKADEHDEAKGANVTDEVVEAEVVDEADTAEKSLNSL